MREEGYERDAAGISLLLSSLKSNIKLLELIDTMYENDLEDYAEKIISFVEEYDGVL